MFEKADKKLVAVAVPLGLAVGLSLTSASAFSADKYAISGASGQVVKSGFNECWESIGGKAGVCGGGAIPVVPARDSDSDGDGVVDSRDECPGTPKGVVVSAFGCPKDSDGDGVADYKDKCPNTVPVRVVDAYGCDKIDKIVINTTTDHFDFDSARLKPAMKVALDDVVAKVNASGADESLLVEGHTDSTGSAAYNQGLSERRAQAAANYLAGKGLDKLTVRGRGESSPIVDNSTREGRAMNRRVEIRSQ